MVFPNICEFLFRINHNMQRAKGGGSNQHAKPLMNNYFSIKLAYLAHETGRKTKKTQV